MYKRVFDIHGWKLSTHAFNEGDIRLYESLTSIGNGYMGMRGNFEEGFSGDSHTGTYIAGMGKCKCYTKTIVREVTDRYARLH